MATFEIAEIYLSCPALMMVQVEIDTLRDESFGPRGKVVEVDLNTSDLGIVQPWAIARLHTHGCCLYFAVLCCAMLHAPLLRSLLFKILFKAMLQSPSDAWFQPPLHICHYLMSALALFECLPGNSMRHICVQT